MEIKYMKTKLLVFLVLTLGANAFAAEKAVVLTLTRPDGQKVRVIEVEKKLYATYIVKDSIMRNYFLLNLSSVCSGPKQQAKESAFALCRANGGKDCRLSLTQTGPRQSGNDGFNGVESCDSTAFVIDLLHPIDESAPVSVSISEELPFWN
jgi:hypothetical protein